MKYAQLNPKSIVMNVVDLTEAQAAVMTSPLIDVTSMSRRPNPGDIWDGARFVTPPPPAPEDTETIRSIARAALADKKNKETIIANIDVETASQEDLRELLAALA